MKVPDRYSSIIARCESVKDGKITDMKSRDFHVFMQDLLKPTFLGILHKMVLEPLSELSSYLKQLCSKFVSVKCLDKLEKSIDVTLYKLEKIFVPSFFTVMMHLPIHLPTGVKLVGHVQFRSMWQFER